MIISMLLAHLVGDYILQWDSLALWKSRELKGVAAHCVVVAIVTILFAIPFVQDQWLVVAFICLAHFGIDAVQLWFKPAIPPLFRFTLDQLAHLIVIVGALIGGGFMEIGSVTAVLLNNAHNNTLLLYALGYAFITMPTWVISKFIAYGLVQGSAPNFPEGSNKYVGIMERLLITTFVALGQFLLVPLVAVPRLVYEWPQVSHSERVSVYMVELLTSVCVAVAIGLALSRM